MRPFTAGMGVILLVVGIVIFGYGTYLHDTSVKTVQTPFGEYDDIDDRGRHSLGNVLEGIGMVVTVVGIALLLIGLMLGDPRFLPAQSVVVQQPLLTVAQGQRVLELQRIQPIGPSRWRYCHTCGYGTFSKSDMCGICGRPF